MHGCQEILLKHTGICSAQVILTIQCKTESSNFPFKPFIWHWVTSDISASLASMLLLLNQSPDYRLVIQFQSDVLQRPFPVYERTADLMRSGATACCHRLIDASASGGFQYGCQSVTLHELNHTVPRTCAYITMTVCEAVGRREYRFFFPLQNIPRDWPSQIITIEWQKVNIHKTQSVLMCLVTKCNNSCFNIQMYHFYDYNMPSLLN